MIIVYIMLKYRIYIINYAIIELDIKYISSCYLE